MTFSNFQSPEFHGPSEGRDAKWTVSAENVAHEMHVVAEFAVPELSEFNIKASKDLAMSFIRAQVPLRPYAWHIEYHDGSCTTFDKSSCPDGLEDRAFPLFREQDNCEVCFGVSGGVRGNENVIDGVITCDYCHAAGRTPPNQAG